MQWFAVLGWVVALEALALLGLAPAAALFRGDRFPDRGAAFALPVAFAVLWVVAYWVGQFRFGVLAVVMAVSALVMVAGVVLGVGGRDAISLRGHLVAMAVFAAAFAFALFLRVVDPGVLPWVGEMFLDFGLLRSLLRAETLPPEDFWFAGEPVRYYYGGHLLWALVAKATGTPARYAFNLAVAGAFATLATTAYGVAGAIAAGRDLPPRRVGLLGAFFVAVAGNLFTPVRLVTNLLPSAWQRTVAATLGLRADLAATHSFWYQNSAWVIPEGNTGFPLLTFVNGNLRPQMVSPVFLLLAAALLLAYFRAPTEARRYRRGLLAATAPVAGVVAVVNTWTFPTVLGLLALTVYFAPAPPRSLLSTRAATRVSPPEGASDRLRREATRGLLALGAAAAVGVAGAALVFPFFATSATSQPVALFPPAAGALSFLVAWGAPLGVFAAYLLGRADTGEAHVDRRTVAAVAAAVVGVPVLLGAPAFGIVVPFVLAGAALLRTRADVGFETVLVVAGAGLLALVEVVYVDDPAAPGRFNTVVKVTMQTWVLWGPATAVALAHLVREGIPTVRPASRLELDDRSRVALRAGLAAALVVSLSLFAGLATVDQMAGDDRAEPGLDGATLDALAFVEERHALEAPAITWLDDREGRPHVVTAPSVDIKYWTGPVSSLTGLPTVAGWNHAADYHGFDAWDRRVRDVRTIYEGNGTAWRNLLAAYDVRYIYVSDRERSRYDVRNFGAADGIEVAYQTTTVTVYEVSPAAFEE